MIGFTGKYKEEIADLKAEIDRLENQLSLKTNENHQEYKKLDSLNNKYKRLNYAYGVQADKRKLVLGKKGGFKTTFVKQVLIPNLPSDDFMVVGRADEYAKTGAKIIDISKGNGIRRESDFYSYIENMQRHQTLIIDDLSTLEMNLRPNDLASVMRLISGKNYIINFHSLNQLKKFHNKYGRIDKVGHVFVTSKVWDRDKYLNKYLELLKSGLISEVEGKVCNGNSRKSIKFNLV